MNVGCFESLASVSSNRRRHLYSVDFPTPFLCANSSTFSLLSDQALSSLSFMSTEARFTILFVLGVMRPRLFAPQHPRTGLPVKGLRRNFLFTGSQRGGERLATVYTLVENCTILGIDPYEYVLDVITKREAKWPVSRLGELTPSRWAAEKAGQKSTE